MKTSICVILIGACLGGCTFHRPTFSDIVDQVRLVNEEKVALQQCDFEVDPGMRMRCQHRAEAWRLPGARNTHAGSSTSPAAEPIQEVPGSTSEALSK